eukprot:363611-Chlamydomonas_euryale.AAC.11
MSAGHGRRWTTWGAHELHMLPHVWERLGLHCHTAQGKLWERVLRVDMSAVYLARRFFLVLIPGQDIQAPACSTVSGYEHPAPRPVENVLSVRAAGERQRASKRHS